MRAGRRGGCRRRGPGGTGRSRPRGSRRSGRSRAGTATGRTGPAAEQSTVGTGATCRPRTSRSPRRAAPRRSSRRWCEMWPRMFGKPVLKFATDAHADGVVVAAGEQRRAGRRAQRRDVEVRVPQPAGGEAVDVRGVDGRAVAAEVGEAGVVEQDHHDVRRTVRGGARRERRRRVDVRLGDNAVEILEKPAHAFPPGTRNPSPAVIPDSGRAIY